MTDVLTAPVVRLKRRAIRANTTGEVGLASDLLKAVTLTFITKAAKRCIEGGGSLRAFSN